MKTWKVAVALVALGAVFLVGDLGGNPVVRDRFDLGAGLVVSGRVWEAPEAPKVTDPEEGVNAIWLFPENGTVTRRARAIAKTIQDWGCGGLCELQAGPDYITLSYQRSF